MKTNQFIINKLNNTNWHKLLVTLGFIILSLFTFTSKAQAQVSYCGTPMSVPFIAGQNINVGNISVANDQNGKLYITISTTGGWVLGLTHVAVSNSLSGIPQNKSGNPIPGQFTYQPRKGS
ncbi:MAG: hypothetical protein ACK5Z5_05390 [Neisseriaceae bacterium]|jgi:hypothetical protein